MRSYIACYTHSIRVLDYTSNSYQMGHYMGDNSQSIFVQLAYRPTRSLRLTLDYTQDTKYRAYDYVRAYIAGQRNTTTPIIAQKPFSEKIWRNDVLKFSAIYEVFNNCYAHVDCMYHNARPYTLEASQYTPAYLAGRTLTVTCGLSFGF